MTRLALISNGAIAYYEQGGPWRQDAGSSVGKFLPVAALQVRKGATGGNRPPWNFPKIILRWGASAWKNDVATSQHREERRSLAHHVATVQESNWSPNCERQRNAENVKTALCEGNTTRSQRSASSQANMSNNRYRPDKRNYS